MIISVLNILFANDTKLLNYDYRYQ